jgi:hypothetical protein
MTSDSRTVTQVLGQAEETLQTARRGYQDFIGTDPSRRMSGLRNAVVFGRAVTNVLENLRNRVEDFDSWYKPRSAALANDAGFRRLYQLRSEILKQGTLQVNNSLHIEYLNTNDLAPLMANPPAGAKSFFIGDSAGGSGWEIELANGDVEKFYVELPPAIKATHDFHLDTPDGKQQVGGLLQRYIGEMESMIRDAKTEFVRGI